VCDDGDTAGVRHVKYVSSTPCRFKTRCNKGEECPYAHPERDPTKTASGAEPAKAASETTKVFTVPELSRAEGVMTYILASKERSDTPPQVEFNAIFKDEAFKLALNLGRDLDEDALLSLVAALGLKYSPSTGMMFLPPSV